MKPQPLFVLSIFLLSLFFSHLAKAGHYLGDLSWVKAEKAFESSLVIIPFAAGAKQHGRHLPMNTDQQILEYLLTQIVKDHDVVIAPPILHGWFAAFRDYPGTEIADATIFQDYVQAVAESLVKSGASNLIFLNMGITRASGLPLSIVARDIRSNHDIPTLVLSWDDLETKETTPLYQQQAGGHADEGETSIMLFLNAQSVDMTLAKEDYGQRKGPQIGYMPGKFKKGHGTGAYGDATLADAEKGQKILNIMTRNLSQALNQFKNKLP